MALKKYIATGLNQLDVVKLVDGTFLPAVMGGIPMYGYCGMRIWSDSVEFLARIGKDFFDYYNPWFDNNQIDHSGLIVAGDKTPYSYQCYDENFNTLPETNFYTGNIKDADYWRPHIEDIKSVVCDETKGFYMTSSPENEIFWEKLIHLSHQFDFKIMWEPNNSHTFPEDAERTRYLCENLPMVSFNVPEAMNIFGIDNETNLIKYLRGLKPELILLRCGARGLYTIHDGEVYFIPSARVPSGASVVDVTGCGNTSTSGACVVWCETADPIMTGIKANISANYNLRQRGPCPLIDGAVMSEAEAMAQDYYQRKLYEKL